MKIINNYQKELLEKQMEIKLYNKELEEINANIIDNNNIKWSISVFVSVFITFIFLSFITPAADSSLLIAIKCILITGFSLIIGILIGSKIVMPFYKPLEGNKSETKSMHFSYLLNKYKPLAVARKGENYLLVLEDKITKIIVRELINFQCIEKINIHEIILDVDNEKLYIPCKK